MTPTQWYEKLTKDNIRPILPTTIPSRIQDMIERGLSNNQLVRPSADELLQVIDECLLFPSGSA